MNKDSVGYVRNCYFVSRDGGPSPLTQLPNGKVIFMMDGYAILPKEQYAALTTAFNSGSDNLLAETLAGKPHAPYSKFWSWLILSLMWAGGIALGYLIWGVK